MVLVVKLAIGLENTVIVDVNVLELPFVAVNVTVNVPGVENMAPGLVAVEVFPLPKFQLYDVAPVERLVKATLRGAQPEVGVAEKFATTCALLNKGVKEYKAKIRNVQKRVVFIFILEILRICPKLCKKSIQSNLTNFMLNDFLVQYSLEMNFDFFERH